MDGWVAGWLGGWLVGWMDGWICGWMDGWVGVCIIVDVWMGCELPRGGGAVGPPPICERHLFAAYW